MIELFTARTPNGRKISIALEEMGLPYSVRVLDLGAGEQKQDWYLAINPNGRIPAIIDHDAGDLAVFESGAILIYLAEMTGMFLPHERSARSQVLAWLMFQMAGVGPMQGQANVFLRYAPETIPYAIERYQNETRRLYGVIDQQLARCEFIAGDLSIADFATYPWLRAHAWAGLSLEAFSHIERWLAQMGERPGVKAGMVVPPDTDPDRDTPAGARQAAALGRRLL